MASLAGRHALVTGGGRGIGRAVAAALTGAGASVTVLGRHAEPLQEAVSRGAAKGCVVADVTDAAAVGAAVQEAAKARGPVDILVANAGSAKMAPFAKATPDMFRDMFAVHVLGMVHAAQAVLGGMRGRDYGRIVAIASIASMKAFPNAAPYVTAKHAMLGLVRSLAMETAKSGITVNAVCPGYVDTDMLRPRIEQQIGRGVSREDAVGEFASRNAGGRLVRPEEVAEAVLYFCSPAAAATNGATLVIGAESA